LDPKETYFPHIAGGQSAAGTSQAPKDFSVHSLRHTTAIMMAVRGVSQIRIKTWLRHKRVSSSELYFKPVRFSVTGKKTEGIIGNVL
jgi:integrase